MILRRGQSTQFMEQTIGKMTLPSIPLPCGSAARGNEPSCMGCDGKWGLAVAATLYTHAVLKAE